MTVASCDLDGIRVLILEDDFYLATDLQAVLERAGATVMGPFSDEAQAREELDQVNLDCAFVDVNLGHGPTFELARVLAARAVPFAFITGYDADMILPEFANVPQLNKPIEDRWVIAAARQLLGREVSSAVRGM